MTIISLATFFKRRVIDVMTLEQTRRRLLALDDRALLDIGIERPLLEQGISLYPWTGRQNSPVEVDTVTTPERSPAKVALTAKPLPNS